MTAFYPSQATDKRAWPSYSPPSADYPIPNCLNASLVAVVFSSALALLWLGSHADHWYAILGVGVLFSYVLLTNYALLHEAVHGNLNSSSRLNYCLGVLTGFLFPIPFSMIRTTHQGHHLRNRTDYEMFDLYYPTDSRLIKHGRWYMILCGLFYPFVPLTALLFALCPAVLRGRFFRFDKAYRYLLGDIQDAEIRSIRVEVFLTVVFFACLAWLLQLQWLNTLILYACFSFNWSTRQYVGHAFSRRDVIEGAWNLRHNRLMSWVLLHGEWDLNHHRRPDLSWYYLPRVSLADEPRPSYIKQYWRQWRGPRLVTEPAPETLQQIPLSVHQ
jgi:fatty acid desaturase